MSTQSFADRRSLEGVKPGVVVVGGLLALMWVLEIIDSASFHSLDQLGIIARNLGSLPHILTAPWLHFGFPHLISNSVPFLILGLLTWLAGPGRWLAVTLITVVTSGLTVWLIAPSNAITLGASGLVFGYLAYLLVRGFFTRNFWEIALSVAVFFFYGSILLGVLPGASGVSWQGHLGGAIGGFIAAKFLHGSDPATRRA
jgi:rhomboid family protein